MPGGQLLSSLSVTAAQSPSLPRRLSLGQHYPSFDVGHPGSGPFLNSGRCRGLRCGLRAHPFRLLLGGTPAASGSSPGCCYAGPTGWRAPLPFPGPVLCYAFGLKLPALPGVPEGGVHREPCAAVSHPLLRLWFRCRASGLPPTANTAWGSGIPAAAVSLHPMQTVRPQRRALGQLLDLLGHL